MQKVQKPINPKCNIALSAPCQNYSINCLLGWADELHTLWKPYQEVEMWLTELQNKYRVAKKTACWYKLWADGKEIHIQQECQRILVGLQNVLLVVQGKAQAALTLFTIMCFFTALLHVLMFVYHPSGESNGKLPLRTCPGCSVPEPYQLPDWALVSAQTGPRAE